MAKLRIPESSIEAFKSFIALGNDGQERLIRELAKAPIGTSSEKLIENLSQSLNLDAENVRQLFNLMVSLFTNMESEEVDVETFVNDVAEALEDKKLKPNQKFKERLKGILHRESPFFITFKANRLAYEREKLLFDTRILTDIRPVFTENETGTAKSFIIIHNLKIQYVEGRQRKEIYLALDTADLQKLKEHISQAESKEKTIKKQLKQIDLPILDVK